MSDASERDRFWGHAAAFGALWGALEATVGSFLHALKVPFGGTMLAATGAALLIALRVTYPRRGVLVAAGAVCAGVKLCSPATVVVGPMVGILVESVLVELACLFGASAPAAIFGGGLATLWALSQKVLTQIVLYGAPVIDLYREVLKRAEAWIGLAPSGGVRVVAPFAALVFAIGATAALAGRRAGGARREAPLPDGPHPQPPLPERRGGSDSRSGASASRLGDRGAGGGRLAILALSLALLVALSTTRAGLHAPLGLALVVLAFALDRGVARALGRPARWVVTGAVLALFGLWLGPRDAHLAGHAVSFAGALAATTMLARAAAIVLLGAAVMARFPPAEALARLRGTRGRRFAEVLVVALELVPTLVARLGEARREAEAQSPGLRHAPRRAFESLVAAVAHASALAESAADSLGADREELGGVSEQEVGT